jgi:hypothetical protein
MQRLSVFCITVISKTKDGEIVRWYKIAKY